MGGGTVFLLIILIIARSMPAATVFRERNDINWGSLRDNVDMDDDLMHLFGNEYSFDGEVSQQLPAGGARG